MQIRLKTSGLLRQYLPTNSTNSSALLDVPEGASPRDVMVELGMPMEDTYLVIVNDEVVPIAERATTKLAANDQLGIFPPLKGG